jgi:hypothetical protein
MDIPFLKAYHVMRLTALRIRELKFGSWRSEIAKQSTQTQRRNNAGRQRRSLDKYRR